MTSTSDNQDPPVRARVQAAMNLHREKRATDAAQAYRQLIADDVAPAIVYSNLASIYVTEGKLADAADLLAQAIAREPDLVDAYLNLGLCLQKQGKAAEAIGPFREAVTRSAPETPLHIRALHRLALSLRDHKDIASEIETWQRLVALRPDNHQFHMELGLALQSAGRLDEAIAAFTKATQLEPRNPQAFANLGFALRAEVRLDETIDAFGKAAELRPGDPAAWLNFGIMLSDQMRIDEALAAFRRALAVNPGHAHAYSALLYLLCHAHQLSPEGYLEVARGFDRDVCGSPPPSPLKRRRIDPSRRIKIALHSAEIGDHAVVNFLESYLRNYDRSRFELFVYSAKPRRDSKSAELQGLPDAFRDIADLSDDDARRTIQGDEIDILIDTTGHTSRGRLQMLSHRCAPIQCHYIGFVATTGVGAMDYFIGDEEIAPASFTSHYSEKLVRLPTIWGAYMPGRDAPEPAQDSPNGTIMLGSFSNLLKVREQTLTVWAAVLNAIPQAQLLVKDWRCADAATCERIRGFLRERGVDSSRVTFLARTPTWYEHMALYNKVDIALDTTPYNSCTTGYDALYMSTPLIAMRSDWTGGRMSSSTLKALGHPEWIANSVDEYVDIARRLAADLPRLKNFKKTLRAEMLASPLCDGKQITRDLEAAFLAMIADHNAAL